MTAPRRVDALVAGAGPAGAAAAVTLARAGLEVAVLDRARFPRDKCCGDGLTAGALHLLEGLGLDPGAVGSWTPVGGLAVRSPSGRVVELPLPEDGWHAVVCRRADLDTALVDLARGAGAEVVEGAGVQRVTVGPDRVEVGDGAGGAWSAPYLVAADGAWSPVRKLVGPAGFGSDRPSGGPSDAPYHGDWSALRRYLTGTGPEAERLWVWFEPDLLPGYAWSFPLGPGRVNFGIGVVRPGEGDRHRDRHRAGARSALADELLERPHIRAVLGAGARPDGPVRAWPIPTRSDPSLLTAGGGRVLFTGDAARLGDHMTGEGVAQALASGAAAARAVAAAGPGAPGRAGAGYREELGAGLLVDNRLAAVLGGLLTSPLVARGTLALVDVGPWSRKNFARWMFESYPRAVLATPRRWGRGMLHPPGAFRPGARPSAGLGPAGSGPG